MTERWWHPGPAEDGMDTLLFNTAGDTSKDITAAFLGMHRTGARALLGGQAPYPGLTDVDETIAHITQNTNMPLEDVFYRTSADTHYAELATRDWLNDAADGARETFRSLVQEKVAPSVALKYTALVFGVPTRYLAEYRKTAATPMATHQAVEAAADKILLETAARMGRAESPDSAVSKWSESEHRRDAAGRFSQMEDSAVRRNKAFETEAMKYQPELMREAMRRTNGDKAAAQDLVQDTYVKALSSFDQFQEGTNMRAWMFRILKNTHTDQYRRQQRLPIDTGLPEGKEHVMDTAFVRAQGKTYTMAEGMDPKLVSAFKALPESHQAVVYLSDVKGMSYDEVAAETGIPVGTVRSRLHRGRKMMRDEIEIEGPHKPKMDTVFKPEHHSEMRVEAAMRVDLDHPGREIEYMRYQGADWDEIATELDLRAQDVKPLLRDYRNQVQEKLGEVADEYKAGSLYIEGIRYPAGTRAALEDPDNVLVLDPEFAQDSLSTKTMRVMEDMSDLDRWVLWRKDWDGLRYEEMAEESQVPVAEIRADVARARQDYLRRMDYPVSKAVLTAVGGWDEGEHRRDDMGRFTSTAVATHTRAPTPAKVALTEEMVREIEDALLGVNQMDTMQTMQTMQTLRSMAGTAAPVQAPVFAPAQAPAQLTLLTPTQIDLARQTKPQTKTKTAAPSGSKTAFYHGEVGQKGKAAAPRGPAVRPEDLLGKTPGGKKPKTESHRRFTSGLAADLSQAPPPKAKSSYEGGITTGERIKPKDTVTILMPEASADLIDSYRASRKAGETVAEVEVDWRASHTLAEAHHRLPKTLTRSLNEVADVAGPTPLGMAVVLGSSKKLDNAFESSTGSAKMELDHQTTLDLLLQETGGKLPKGVDPQTDVFVFRLR